MKAQIVDLTARDGAPVALPPAVECLAWLQEQRRSDSRLDRLMSLCEKNDLVDDSGTVVALRPVGVSAEIAALIYWLTRKSGGGATLETGFGYGVAAAFFGLAAGGGAGASHYCFDPYLDWTRGIGQRLLDELSLRKTVVVSHELANIGAAELYRRLGPDSVAVALFDGTLLFEDLMADFAVVRRMLRRGGAILIRQPYLPQVTALLSFIAANHRFEVTHWSDNLAVVRRVADDDRPWFHFQPFAVPLEGHVVALENGLVETDAPDGQRLVFANETSHQYYLRRVLHGREYPPLFPDVFRPTTILDVGAHVGSAARYFAQQYPQARIVCVEPTPESFALLGRNTAHLANIERHPVAFVDKPGTVRIWRGKQSSGQNSAVPNEENDGSDFFDVTGVEPLAFCRAQGLNDISILKLDIEGLEIDVLRNLAPLLPNIQVFYIEYHSEALRREIESLLSDYVLFASKATEAFRGTACYVRATRLEELMRNTSAARYVYAKES